MKINMFRPFLTAVTTFVNRVFIPLLRSTTTQVSTELLLFHTVRVLFHRTSHVTGRIIQFCIATNISYNISSLLEYLATAAFAKTKCLLLLGRNKWKLFSRFFFLWRVQLVFLSLVVINQKLYIVPLKLVVHQYNVVDSFSSNLSVHELHFPLRFFRSLWRPPISHCTLISDHICYLNNCLFFSIILNRFTFYFHNFHKSYSIFYHLIAIK